MRILLFTFILLLLFPCNNWAQIHDIKFNLVTGKQGVSLGKINGITQDPSGYMWFADQTQRCITRYDGYSMESFRNDPSKNNSLGGTYPECILADAAGNVWVGFTGTGLDRFNPQTGQFTHYRHQPNDPASLANDTVNAILIDHLGNIWVGGYEGLDLLDAKTGKFKHYAYKANVPTSLSNNRIRALYEDKQGTLWIGCGSAFENDRPGEGGLNRFNRATGTFTRYLNDPKNPNTLINNKVRAIFEDSKGTFWVGTAGDGLHTMDRSTGVFKRYPYNPAHPENLSRPPVRDFDDHITFFEEDGTGAIWIGTYKAGLSRYDPVTKTVTRFNPYTSKWSGFIDNSPWTAYTSRDNVLWISTEQMTLYSLDPFHITIPHIPAAGSVNSFFQEANGVLWISTDSGLIRNDRGKNVSKQVIRDSRNIAKISSEIIMGICGDDRGNLWMGTNGGGLDKLDIKTRTFTHYRHDFLNNNSLISNVVFKTYVDQDGSLWIGTTNGLDQLNLATGNFTHYQHNPKDINSLSNNSVTDILQDKQKRLWVGTYYGSGINEMDLGTHQFKHYLNGLDINSICQDLDGIIWAGTIGGLYRFDAQKGDFAIFTVPGSEVRYYNVTSIVEDNERNLWMGTSEGIIKLNSKRDKFTTYGKNHGVLNSLNFMAVYKGLNNELFFGSANGYYNFFPQQLTKNSKPPEILLADFRVKDKPVNVGKKSTLSGALLQTKEIELTYKQNVFSFDFAAIDYRNPAENQHLFMLENYDNQWHQAGSQHTAYYYNVPPGNYTFKVKVANSEGIWAEKAITITINPPWWRTWWAYCMYAIFLIAIVYALQHIQRQRVLSAERERTRERELAQAKEIEKAYEQLKATQLQLLQSEKMASLGELTAGIAHEIRNPLNFITNFSEVNKDLIDELEQQINKGNTDEVRAIATGIKENEQKINLHGKRADAIVNSMLQHSRHSTGNKEVADINALTDEYLRLAFHGFKAKDKTFNTKIETHFDYTIDKLSIVPQDIGRVLLNLLSNAFYAVNIKKTQLNGTFQPAISVTTKQLDNKIEVTIRDNGYGIPQKNIDKIFQPFFTTKPSGEGTGLGLSLSYDIIKAHGGELKVSSTEGEGAEFIISLPA